ncbi:MAG: 2-oxoacid:acceptor oxidoreductase subunit alpha [bacterium]
MSAKTRDDRIRVMTGNEACAEAALAAGLKFFAGYPITPSSEIAEELSSRLPRSGGRFIQMEDEISAMGAVIGASLAGAKSMTATSGPGFSLKQENIGYACITEVPCVIVNVMRGGPSTGLPTMPQQSDVMQARWGTHGDHPIITLVPQSVAETIDLTVRAFSLTEKYRIPVILLMDETVGHISEKIRIPAYEELEIYERVKPSVPPAEYLPYLCTENDIPEMATFGTGYRFHVTGLCHDETGFPTNDPVEIEKQMLRINRKLERYRDDIIEVVEDGDDDAEIGIIAYGSTARSAKRAMLMAQENGIKACFLRPRTMWPFPDREIRAMGEKVDTIVVPEMNLGQVAHEVEWAVAGRADVVKVNKINGEPISPPEILAAIEKAVK